MCTESTVLIVTPNTFSCTMGRLEHAKIIIVMIHYEHFQNKVYCSYRLHKKCCHYFYCTVSLTVLIYIYKHIYIYNARLPLRHIPPVLLPHTHARITHTHSVVFLMYYLSCFVAHLFLLLNKQWAAPHSLSPCVYVSASSHWSPVLFNRLVAPPPHLPAVL